MLRYKLMRAETKVLDEREGLVRAVMSTEAKDRDGDIIRQDYWQLEDFQRHPALISGHDYRDIRSQIGEWQDVTVRQRPKRLEGTARYYIGAGNEQADWGFELAKRGRAAYSVGFIPDMAQAEIIEGKDSSMPTYEFKGQRLLEISHVTIPANPQALQLAKAAYPSMHPEVMALIDEALKDQGSHEYQGMDLDALVLELWKRLEPRLLDMRWRLLDGLSIREANLIRQVNGPEDEEEEEHAEEAEEVIAADENADGEENSPVEEVLARWLRR